MQIHTTNHSLFGQVAPMEPLPFGMPRYLNLPSFLPSYSASSLKLAQTYEFVGTCSGHKGAISALQSTELGVWSCSSEDNYILIWDKEARYPQYSISIEQIEHSKWSFDFHSCAENEHLQKAEICSEGQLAPLRRTFSCVVHYFRRICATLGC